MFEILFFMVRIQEIIIRLPFFDMTILDSTGRMTELSVSLVPLHLMVTIDIFRFSPPPCLLRF